VIQKSFNYKRVQVKPFTLIVTDIDNTKIVNTFIRTKKTVGQTERQTTSIYTVKRHSMTVSRTNS